MNPLKDKKSSLDNLLPPAILYSKISFKIADNAGSYR